MAKYEMKFMFDWCSGTCVWSTNDAAIDKYGYPVDLDDLPISSKLKIQLENLIEKHDEALNWSDPSSELLWTGSQQDEFKQKAIVLYHLLCKELGSDFNVKLWEHYAF